MASIFYLITTSIMSYTFHAEALAFPLSKVFESQGLEGSKNFVRDKPTKKLVRKRILYATNEAALLESKEIESIRNLDEFDVRSFWYVKFI